MNVAIKQIMSEIQLDEENRAKEVPVTLIMDEFQQLSKLREVHAAMSLARGYNLILFPIVQDLGAMMEIYGEKAFYTFINNCGAVQCLQATDPITTGYISDHLGKSSYSASWGEKPQSVPLRAPDQVRLELSEDRMLQYLLRGNKKTILCERVPYFRHPIYSKIAKKYKGWDKGPKDKTEP